MTDIVGELARVGGAFDQPTLTLLYKSHARVVIAMFRGAFTRDSRSVPAARLHAQVDTYLDHLRRVGMSIDGASPAHGPADGWDDPERELSLRSPFYRIS
ncbi:DUF3375 family protein [Dactylosporangium sp. NPDC005572]|uniref:DUF3375 family protein n=1 Tax=Dactylosporangium sp. NPDC005572 TaxID=3156889 RepID=UPI0033B03D81